MRPILYSAIGKEGKPETGYVDANSNAEALSILRASGLTNIELHDDYVTSQERPELKSLDKEQLGKLAAAEIQIRRGEPKLKTFLYLHRDTIVTTIVGLVIVVAGFLEQSNTTIVIGSTLALLTPAYLYWIQRHARRYNALMAAFARGNWRKARHLITLLKKHVDSGMVFDLDAREAAIDAMEGDLDLALKKLETWKISMDCKSPGMYESRISSLYQIQGNYAACLDYLRQALEKNPDNPVYILDLAMSEARLGSIDKAAALLEQLDTSALITMAKPYLSWAKGIIALKNNSYREALELLGEAHTAYLAMQNNPIFWISLSLCSAYLSLVLHHQGQTKTAEDLLAEAWPIVKLHGEKPLLDAINEQFGNHPGLCIA